MKNFIYTLILFLSVTSASQPVFAANNSTMAIGSATYIVAGLGVASGGGMAFYGAMTLGALVSAFGANESNYYINSTENTFEATNKRIEGDDRAAIQTQIELSKSDAQKFLLTGEKSPLLDETVSRIQEISEIVKTSSPEAVRFSNGSYEMIVTEIAAFHM